MRIDLKVLALTSFVVAGCGPGAAFPAERQVVNVVRSHDRAGDAYTQGLLWYQGKIYESTGQYGQSSLRRIDPGSGTVELERRLPPMQFGEGLARVGELLYQLTWRAGVAYVYTLDSFEEIDRFSYEGQGWGLCFDGRRLVMSDGSDRLSYRDPTSFEVMDSLAVTLDGKPLDRLNELECVEGWIFANVYQTDMIVKIDPDSGRVVTIVDASGLLSDERRARVDVLNGIAYDGDREVFYLTGKYWPKLFEVTFVSR